jgi:hypothetical protein
MQSVLETLAWSKPEKHPVSGVVLQLKVAPATSEFWAEYRGFEEEWFMVGVSVSKRGLQWYVKWWSNPDGVFDTQRPPKIAHPSATARSLALASRKKH